MNLSTAQNAFMSLLNALGNEDKSEFLLWCKERFFTGATCSKAYFDLRTIAEDIKLLIPSEAIFPSEKINHSSLGYKSEGINEPLIHVDSFLFEDEHIDALVEEGKLSRNYCKNCGSFDVSPITFVSHSTSIQRIEFIFQCMLPDLTDKVILDVGSRLGAILYGAYYLSSAKKIIGVELNEDMCKVQRHIIDKYGLSDRIEVICDNICNVPGVIQTSDVIIFNNVFECFMPTDMQENIWIWFRRIITKTGTMLVTVPSMEETISKLKTGIDVSTWLRRIEVTDIETKIKVDDENFMSEICLYVVI